MKKTIVGLVYALTLCALVTLACSPYELEDPNEARIVILTDRNADDSNEAVGDIDEERATKP